MFCTIGKGSWLVLASQVFAVFVHSLAKFLETTGDVEPQQILQVRMFVTLGLNCISLVAWFPLELPLGNHQIGYILAIRVLGGICGSFGYYYSLRYLSLGDATVINLLAPLGAGLLLSKRLDLLRMSSAVICLLGVGLITKPAFALNLLAHGTKKDYSGSSIGFIFAFIGVIGGVIAYSAISFIGQRVHPLAITNCFAVGILLTSGFCFILVPGVEYKWDLNLIQWFVLFLIGIFGAFMEFFLTAGLALGKDGTAIYMICLQVVLSLAADASIWGTSPDTLSFVGSLLVLSAVIIAEKSKEQSQKGEYLEMEQTEVLPHNQQEQFFDQRRLLGQQT